MDCITDSPAMTMAQEWGRNDQWLDWKGNEYGGRHEWEYVMNPVGEGEWRSGVVGWRAISRSRRWG